MDKDALSVIFGFADYRSLYIMIRISKLWQKVSQNQLIIRHKSNPILPILHNRQLRTNFVDVLHDIYQQFIKDKCKSVKHFIQCINANINYGYYDYEFIGMITPYTDQMINKLYDHIIMNIPRIVDYLSSNMIISTMSYDFDNSSLLFEQGFAIYMYLRGLLTHIFEKDAYNQTLHYRYIQWDIKSFDIDAEKDASFQPQKYIFANRKVDVFKEN